MKLQELKAKVYELAAVQTTKQLKAQYEELRSLDMRRKSSWEKALEILQPPKTEFEQWLENPPDEYKELFSEIDAANARYDEKAARAKELGDEVFSMIDSLEELANESQEESDRLKHELALSKKISKQSELN